MVARYLQALGDDVVDDVAHVGLVDAHAERDGGHHHLQPHYSWSLAADTETCSLCFAIIEGDVGTLTSYISQCT